MEYLPIVIYCRPFSKLSTEVQAKCLGQFRNSKILGLAAVIQFLQTHVILAAYDGFGR